MVTSFLSAQVQLSIEAERHQAAGFPIVVNLSMTNIADSDEGAVNWWCGGPKSYPPAEHFIVSVRYNAESEWHEVEPTNGQHVQGSGFTGILQPGESIITPLAIPIELPDSGMSVHQEQGDLGWVSIRVSTKKWKSEKSVETDVSILGRRKDVDGRREELIKSVLVGTDSFSMHLAAKYPDSAIMDALLKMVTVDCQPIARRSAQALVHQSTLPEKSGDELADAVRRWAELSCDAETSATMRLIAIVALKSQSESGRKAVLELLKTQSDSRTLTDVFDVLRLSPGDLKWLKRARSAIESTQQTEPDDQELNRFANLSINWLNSRIQNIEASEEAKANESE